MNRKKLPEIGAISMVKDDRFFIPRWMNYYGGHLGYENLFLILDGMEQTLPDRHERINVIKVPGLQQKRASGDRNRAKIVSSLASALFQRYDIILAHDIDEILVLDPNPGLSLKEYLAKLSGRASFSALGLDVGQHLEDELPIDPGRPFLEQRSFAHVSARYTKAVVAKRPVNWGSGFHRVRGRNFRIDPNLFLFHFGMVDFKNSTQKTSDESLIKSGWKGHLNRRHEIFDLILKKTAIDGDEFFARARKRQQLFRPIYALNKPGTLREKPVVKIPERFRTIV